MITLKKLIKDVVIGVVLCIILFVGLILGLIVNTEAPTKEIKEKEYKGQLQSIEVVNSYEVDSAKVFFTKAIEETTGKNIEDCYIRIFTHDGVTKIKFYWFDGTQYYKSSVWSDGQCESYQLARIIMGYYYKDKILGAHYEDGHISVSTTPLQEYDFLLF